MPVPDGVFPTFSRHLPVFDCSVSSPVPVRSTAVSSIAPWIPSPLPRLAARPATPKAVAGARECYRTSVAQIGIRRRLQRQPQLRPAFFVDINSGYPIWHTLPPGGSGERARDYIKQGRGLLPLSRGGETTHHLFALPRTLRIRQIHGLGFSTVRSISPTELK